MPPRRLPLLFLTALLLTAACSGDDGDSDDDGAATTGSTLVTDAGPPVAVTVEGPITGGRYDLPYNAMPEGFEEEYGYREDEWFVSGTATAYTSAEPLAIDGAWNLEPAREAPYTTRIIVRQPADADDFNGVVLVEWLNVTAGRDSDADFGFLYQELLGQGYAYVGVSAQSTGIEGGDSVLEVPGVPPEALVPLKEWDPERYEPLQHPGDEYSYDLFTQMGAVAAGRADVDPLEGLDVTTVLAAGESQSAARMVSYVNGIHPLADTFDGFLVHSRGGGAAVLGEGEDDAPPTGVHVRSDLDAPVLILETETDLPGLGFTAARQPDSDTIATWEVAGTAHADQATLDYGIASGSRWSDAGATLDLTELCGPANTGPQGQVARAALERLRAWAEEGTVPPTASPLEVAGDGSLVRDVDGIAVGGIRTPDVDAPIATLTGEGNPVSVFCSLFGQVTPFSDDRLAELYPTHDDYVAAVTTAADESLDQGFILEPDRDAFVAAAERSDVDR